MDDGREHTNIVEFYPLRFEKRSRPSLNEHDGLCYIKIDGTHFTRTVYRPLIGPDMLLAQTKVTRTYGFSMKFELPGSRSDLYDTIMRFLSVELEENRNLHPDWNLENLAEHICRFAESRGFSLQGRAPQLFVLTAVEAFVELSIMSAAAGWKMGVWKEGLAPEPPIDIVECTLCHDQDMTHGNSIALNCGDVFHKHCFFPLWWEDEGTNCPQCARKCL